MTITIQLFIFLLAILAYHYSYLILENILAYIKYRFDIKFNPNIENYYVYIIQLILTITSVMISIPYILNFNSFY